MKKILQIPKNWQDFEDVCKELWRDNWPCREIQSHGRNGQAQYGVDVFGIPDGEDKYYGIQCKHKSIGEELTESEVDHEIQEAYKFPTPLKMLYIVTTANNDAKIQKHVMLKDVENREKGLFGIRVYSWSEISDLLRQHTNVLNWYMEEKFYQRSMQLYVNSCRLGEEPIVLNPHFNRLIDEVVLVEPIKLSMDQANLIKPNKALLDFYKDYRESIPEISLMVTNPLIHKVKLNRSLIELEIDIDNTGEQPFENFFLFLNIRESDYNRGIHFQISEILVEDNELERREKEVRFHEDNQVINGGMRRRVSTYIYLPKEEAVIYIDYHFNAKNFKINGTFCIKNEPVIIDLKKRRFTNRKDEVSFSTTITDIIEEEERNILDI
ncbi:MAG: hypothetical protein WCS68_02030 [Bacilli bacterium]